MADTSFKIIQLMEKSKIKVNNFGQINIFLFLSVSISLNFNAEKRENYIKTDIYMEFLSQYDQTCEFSLFNFTHW